MSKADPTIEQFIRLTKLKISPGELSPIEADIECAKILYPDMTEDEINDLSIEEFAQMTSLDWLNTAPPLESFAVAGQIWRYKRRVGTTGYSVSIRAMQEIAEAMTRDNIDYLAQLLAALYEPTEPVADPVEVLRANAKVAWAMPFVHQIKNRYAK